MLPSYVIPVVGVWNMTPSFCAFFAGRLFLNATSETDFYFDNDTWISNPAD
ncbi:hypothetical protein Bca4012_025262 [Brassica carinata]